jgi:hypothetical protein
MGDGGNGVMRDWRLGKSEVVASVAFNSVLFDISREASSSIRQLDPIPPILHYSNPPFPIPHPPSPLTTDN